MSGLANRYRLGYPHGCVKAEEWRRWYADYEGQLVQLARSWYREPWHWSPSIPHICAGLCRS